MASVANATPYNLNSKLRSEGWTLGFETSGGGHPCVTVPGAPSLGSSPGDLLFFGHWTKHDGTTIYNRSNMDRSITTIVLDPMGNIIHNIHTSTLWENTDEVRKLIDRKAI